MKVSIVVPVYNCEAYVRKCLGSISCQTYKDMQIIVIDDGSTDSSLRIVEEFAKSDGRIKVVHQENQGVCVARNNGIDMATGEYLTFVDGDDYLEDDYIDRMIAEALNKDSDLVISGFISEQADGSKRKVTVPSHYYKDEDEMWAYRLSAIWGRMYRKDTWDRFHIQLTPQKGVRGEDVPICLMTNYICRNISTIEYAGYHYIQHFGSAMSQMKGLKKYGFPYEAMDELALIVNEAAEHNSKKYFDFGILKFFAHFYYYFGFGADKDIKREMLTYFRHYLAAYCPEYKESWKYVKVQSDLPLSIMMAIELLVRTQI